MAEEWKCPGCQAINPGKRAECIGCGTPRPSPEEAEKEKPVQEEAEPEWIWKGQRWEYRCMTLGLDPGFVGLRKARWTYGDLKGWGNIWPEIEDAGRFGWDLVSVTPWADGTGMTTQFYLWFKRPLAKELWERIPPAEPRGMP